MRPLEPPQSGQAVRTTPPRSRTGAEAAASAIRPVSASIPDRLRPVFAGITLHRNNRVGAQGDSAPHLAASSMACAKISAAIVAVIEVPQLSGRNDGAATVGSAPAQQGGQGVGVTDGRWL